MSKQELEFRITDHLVNEGALKSMSSTGEEFWTDN